MAYLHLKHNPMFEIRQALALEARRKQNSK
jgi:hypothetical protein